MPKAIRLAIAIAAFALLAHLALKMCREMIADPRSIPQYVVVFLCVAAFLAAATLRKFREYLEPRPRTVFFVGIGVLAFALVCLGLFAIFALRNPQWTPPLPTGVLVLAYVTFFMLGGFAAILPIFYLITRKRKGAAKVSAD